MKKPKIIVVLIMALTVVGTPSDAKADLIKKIKKAIKQTEEAIDKTTKIITGKPSNSSSNQGSTYSSGKGSSEYGPAPGVDLIINDVTRWGDGMLVFYTLKNNMAQDINNFHFTYNSGISRNEDSRGCFDDGTEFYTSFDINSLSVPAEGKRTGYVKVSKVPRNVRTADLMLFARCNTGPVVTKSNPYGVCLYSFTSLPIRDFLPSNVNGVYCTHPDLKINVNKIERKDNSVEIDFSLINPTEQDLDYWLMDYDGVQVLDADGNGYDVSLYLPGSKSLKVPAEGGKTRIVASIPNVPKRVNEFQQIIIPFGNNDYTGRFKFVFRNLKID